MQFWLVCGVHISRAVNEYMVVAAQSAYAHNYASTPEIYLHYEMLRLIARRFRARSCQIPPDLGATRTDMRWFSWSRDQIGITFTPPTLPQFRTRELPAPAFSVLQLRPAVNAMTRPGHDLLRIWSAADLECHQAANISARYAR